jgi:hypothetical protein
MKSPERLNLRNLDPTILACFKAEAARRGRTMKGLMSAFMKQCTEFPTKENKGVLDVGRLSRRHPNPR